MGSVPVRIPLALDDSSQLFIPDSFRTLFVPTGRMKPTASCEEIAERYEFCEDLAQMLVDTCKTLQARDGLAEDIVLDRVRAGLGGDAATVTGPEADWVVRRTAELMDWPVP